MLKRLASLTLAAMLVCGIFLIPAANALTTVDTYAKARLSEGAEIYAGPGTNYVRLGFASKSSVNRIYGIVENGWMLLGYQYGTDKYRVAYAKPETVNDLYDIQGTINYNLSFSGAVDTYISGACNLTDDPVMSNSRVTGLSDGTPVKLLGKVGGWAHIEVQKGNSLYRGFVRTFRVAALIDNAPTQKPTAKPTQKPTPKPEPEPTVKPTPIYTAPPYIPPVTPPPYTPPVSLNSRLSSLRHNCTTSGKMVPESFNPNQTSYLLTMASNVSYVRLTPTAYYPDAYITVNGQYVTSGTQSQQIYLTDQPQAVTIVVYHAGETTAYTVFLQRRPDERRTRVSIGFINSIYRDGNDWYINADLATIKYYGEDYGNGNLSSYTNTSSSEQYRYKVNPHCIFYYGTMTYPYRTTNIHDFMNTFRLYGSNLYRIIYIEDEIVAVIPYAADDYLSGWTK